MIFLLYYKQYELKILRKLEIEKSLIDASIEDPGAGYDLISWRKDDNGNLYKIFIETKNNEIIIGMGAGSISKKTTYRG